VAVATSRLASRVMSAMDHTTVRIILEKVISSPANVNLAEFDEAIQWVENRGAIRQLDRGTDRDVYCSQFEAAAVQMRVLRRLLARGWFNGATESAQHLLRLLGREVSLSGTPSPAPAPVIGSSTETHRWESSRTNLQQTTPHTKAVIKLVFRYTISILGLLLFAGLLALISWWLITTPPQP
jgi:hypothetical protein